MRVSLRTEWKFRQHILDAVEPSLIQHQTYTDAHLIYKINITTLKEEIVQVQNDMIERGLVYCIGARSMTRRVIQQLQNICENQGWQKFVAIQTCCNLLNRKKEREMISHHQNNGVDMSLQCALAFRRLARLWNGPSTERSAHATVHGMDLGQGEGAVKSNVHRVKAIA